MLVCSMLRVDLRYCAACACAVDTLYVRTYPKACMEDAVASSTFFACCRTTHLLHSHVHVNVHFAVRHKYESSFSFLIFEQIFELSFVCFTSSEEPLYASPAIT